MDVDFPTMYQALKKHGNDFSRKIHYQLKTKNNLKNPFLKADTIIRMKNIESTDWNPHQILNILMIFRQFPFYSRNECIRAVKMVDK